MSTQREHAIGAVTGDEGRVTSGESASPITHHPSPATPVILPVPPSVAAPRVSARAGPSARRDAVHVAANLHTLVAAALREDTRPAVAEQERRDLNAIVHDVLIVGLVISTTLMLAGVGLDVFYQRDLPTAVPNIGDVISRVLALRPSGFLALGLLALIATPILRVIGSIGAFLYERDWRFAGVATVVLLVLITSLLLGRG